MRKFLFTIATFLTITAAPGMAEQPPRSVNITPDSARGWIPTEEQAAEAERAALSYFRANDEGLFAASYAMLTPEMKRQTHVAEHTAVNRAFNAEAGALVSRAIIKVTWTKDPANAPRSGIYAAIDLATRYANIDRHCGYIIMYQVADGQPFMVMRTQSTMFTNAAAEQMRANGQDVDQTWAQLSKSTCPNYSPAPASKP